MSILAFLGVPAILVAERIRDSGRRRLEFGGNFGNAIDDEVVGDLCECGWDHNGDGESG